MAQSVPEELREPSRNMSPAAALAILGCAVSEREPDNGYYLALSMDWAHFPHDWYTPLLERVIPPQSSQEQLRQGSGNTQPLTPLFRILQATDAEQRRQKLVDHLRREACEMLNVAPVATEEAVEKGLFAMGMDSMMAVAYGRKIQKQLGVAFPATWPVTAPDFGDLAGRLLDRATFSETSVTGNNENAKAVEPTPDQEPIAIVGSGLYLPGEIQDLDALWAMLNSAGDLRTEIPMERFDIDALYDADPDAPGKSYTRFGYFIRNPSLFDADLFDLSPREAEVMDPQHRLLLQCGWRALEQAGLPPESLKKTKTGVYLGIGPSEYDMCQDRSLSVIDAMDVTGDSHEFLRWSYILSIRAAGAKLGCGYGLLIVSCPPCIWLCRLFGGESVNWHWRVECN